MLQTVKSWWRGRSTRRRHCCESSRSADREAAVRPHNTSQSHRVQLFVALDKQIVSPANHISGSTLRATAAGLGALRCLGVEGVVLEVWWGLVEAAGPGQYDWSSNHTLLQKLRELGLTVKVELCFHGNSHISLPPWVLDAGQHDPDIFFTDAELGRCFDCLSLGVDGLPVLHGRTPLHVYTNLMTAFRDEFADYLGTTIVECTIGLGPGGELRYPSTPMHRWEFPGVGEFQCYDRYMLASLRACSREVGQPDWGEETGKGPHDAGHYCRWPHQTGFFNPAGAWTTPYGTFFLQWYSELLLKHGSRVLSSAATVFARSGALLAAKVPSLHWWYNTPSRAAELTAGIFNTHKRDGYTPVVALLARANAKLLVGNAEMRNTEQPLHAACGPEEQLLQWRTTAAALGVPVGLENTLLRFDPAAYNKLETTIYTPCCSEGIDLPRPASLTFKHMCNDLFEPANWHDFKLFVRKLGSHEEDRGFGRSQLLWADYGGQDAALPESGLSPRQQAAAMV
ncbi:hypothetical protein WJX72_008396 [[Myrmecia] bisecta]|uniref:Beta-amylase n=1 Tax=[Myrmecia] bisecta TaxID=41462 RepID=A0AAW1QFT6_9CHLO